MDKVIDIVDRARLTITIDDDCVVIVKTGNELCGGRTIFNEKVDPKIVQAKAIAHYKSIIEMLEK